MKQFNVLDYGAHGDGKTLDSKYVQAAVDACFAAGGGEVLFPEGDFVSATVFLRNNVTVRISEKARILGSLNFDDYNPDEKVDYPLYQDASHSFFECALFVGIDCENIGFCGGGEIDMRSVWDEENKRNMVNRGAKSISLKNCRNVNITNISVKNSTDLAIYFAGCENVEVSYVKMRVYIDGISPDCSKNVKIHDCDIESGDDGIVLKSSYTLNRLSFCENVQVYNCTVKSRCNAVKFGTESNGGFKNVTVRDCFIKETRITGIAVESVDGAVIDNIRFENITMKNVGAPIFVHLGKRLRGPENTKIGKIGNITFKNIKACGEYVPYNVIPWNYSSYKDGDTLQKPWLIGGGNKGYNIKPTENDVWQITSNICGLKGYPIENITFEDIDFTLDGGAEHDDYTVAEEADEYPEVYTYGRIYPSSGFYFRDVDGLMLKNVKISTYRKDFRKPICFERVKGLNVVSGN